MSSQSVVENTGNQAHITTDLSKSFLWDYATAPYSYTNDSYDAVTLAAGTVMGRISATGKVIPLQSDASDGSQFPIGIVLESRTVDAGDTVTLSLVVSGKVAVSKLIFTKSGDTIATVVSGKRLDDRLGSDTVGIHLETSTENSGYDNQ